jgi:hypothetical protein
MEAAFADSATDSADRPIGDWDLRPWVLGALLALTALALHFVTEGLDAPDAGEPEPWRAALAGFLFFGGLSAAFTLERSRLLAAALFALLIGLVMGGIAYNLIRLDERVAGGEFAFAAGVFFTLLALPLFQSDFHRTRIATDYRETHFHVWADAVSGGGALAFTALSWLLLLLLNGLFGLVGIDLIADLMDEGWFAWTWSGAAFGAGLGVLRENLKIIGALQNVVMVVFSLLAVPFAAALLVFLVLLLASGGNALWEATDSATPILLACAAGSFVLFNAIIRDRDAERSRSRIMQGAAALLAAGILPLVVFAAISMGIRIDQYGLAPERIWALIAIAVAAAYGLAAWVALARGRLAGWSEALRQANLRLAAGVCVVALVLAMPLWDFGAISARNQVARLESGKVRVDAFDFAALRWDFGDAGRAVLARLVQGEGEVAKLAGAAEAQTVRVYDWQREQVRAGFTGALRVQPQDPVVEASVREYLAANPWLCGDYCVAVDLGENTKGQREVAIVQRFGFERVVLDGTSASPVAAPAKPVELQRDSQVEIREETARYIYVDGERIGGPVD